MQEHLAVPYRILKPVIFPLNFTHLQECHRSCLVETAPLFMVSDMIWNEFVDDVCFMQKLNCFNA